MPMACATKAENLAECDCVAARARFIDGAMLRLCTTLGIAVRTALLAALCLAICTSWSMAAQDNGSADFSGRTLRIIIGYAPVGSAEADTRVSARQMGPLVPGPGNSFDVYSRVLARFLGRHLAGTPHVLVQNMPGAGGLRAMAHLTARPDPDGLMLVMPGPLNVVEPLLDPTAAAFDARTLSWIGSMNREAATCAFWSPDIRSLDDLKRRRVYVGSTGPLASATQETRVLAALLGLRLDIVLGYPQSMDIRHPAERGEVDGFCGLLISNIGPSAREDLAAGKFRLVLQTGLRPHREVGDILPLVHELVEEREAKDILKLVFGPMELGKALAASPQVAPHRLHALRHAFDATMEDPDFRFAAARAGIEINPVAATEINALLADFHAIPAPTLQRARSIMRPRDP